MFNKHFALLLISWMGAVFLLTDIELGHLNFKIDFFLSVETLPYNRAGF